MQALDGLVHNLCFKWTRVLSLTAVSRQQIHKAAGLHLQAAKYSCRSGLVCDWSSLYINSHCTLSRDEPEFWNETQSSISLCHDDKWHLQSESHCRASFCSPMLFFSVSKSWDFGISLALSLSLPVQQTGWITSAYQETFSPLEHRFVNFREWKKIWEWSSAHSVKSVSVCIWKDFSCCRNVLLFLVDHTMNHC